MNSAGLLAAVLLVGAAVTAWLLLRGLSGPAAAAEEPAAVSEKVHV